MVNCKVMLRCHLRFILKFEKKSITFTLNLTTINYYESLRRFLGKYLSFKIFVVVK